jgi:predicted transcriptional regulator
MSSGTSGKLLHIDASEYSEATLSIFKALASDIRLSILIYLSDRVVNVNEIADALDISASAATTHVQILEQAGLIRTEVKPASRGLQKLCARTYDQLLIQLPHVSKNSHKTLTITMPIGAYTDFEVRPTCGLVNENHLIGLLDHPTSFYEPDHIHAQLIWFHEGFLEYRFPNQFPNGAIVESLELSMEICSEAPLHHMDWPSDITLWMNGVEVGTWSSPADFGGKRGALTPAWWEEKDSQYGLLKVWRVSHTGSFIDGKIISSVTLGDLAVTASPAIRVRIGVKPDAYNVGGINIFGEKFGNYPQPIILRAEYSLDPTLGNNDERRINRR